MKEDTWKLWWDEASILKLNRHLVEGALSATFAGTYTEPFNFFENEVEIIKPNLTYSNTLF